MVSRLLRRSGVAVVQVAELLDNWTPDNIIQVGIGTYHEEIDVMHEVWPDAKIVGFEPHPQITIKDYPGKIFPMAVGEKSGTTTLYSKKRHKDGSSIHPHKDGQYKDDPTFEVPMIALDHISCIDLRTGCSDSHKTLLWLDCEGSELSVLKGARALLTLCVDIVNVEMTSKSPGDGWCSPNDVHDFLNQHGYLRQWQHTYRTCSGQYDAMYVRKEMFDPQYSICPCQVKLFNEVKIK